MIFRYASSNQASFATRYAEGLKRSFALLRFFHTRKLCSYNVGLEIVQQEKPVAGNSLFLINRCFNFAFNFLHFNVYSKVLNG
jgi:hypothetical protein